jgi:hypothetical protein
MEHTNHVHHMWLQRNRMHRELLDQVARRAPAPEWCSARDSERDPDDLLYQHLLEHIAALRNDVDALAEQPMPMAPCEMRQMARREWVVMATPGLAYDYEIDTWMYRNCCGTGRQCVQRYLDRRTKQWIGVVDELPYDSVPRSLLQMMESADRA